MQHLRLCLPIFHGSASYSISPYLFTPNNSAQGFCKRPVAAIDGSSTMGQRSSHIGTSSDPAWVIPVIA